MLLSAQSKQLHVYPVGVQVIALLLSGCAAGRRRSIIIHSTTRGLQRQPRSGLAGTVPGVPTKSAQRKNFEDSGE